jgi:hypothetical protein
MVGMSVTGSGTASAREPDATRAAAAAPANSVNSTSVVNESLTGADVKNGTLNQSDLNPAIVNLLRTPKANSVWSSTLNNDVVTEAKLAPSVRNKLVMQGIALVSGSTIIDADGFFHRVGAFTMPAGVYTISTSATFRRTEYQPAILRPGVWLRFDGYQYAGQIGGVEISTLPSTQLDAFTARRVVFSRPTTIAVEAFGTHDDGSSAGQIDVKVEVMWARG